MEKQNDIENLRAFLIYRQRWLSLSHINDVVLNLPTKLLFNFVKRVKYRDTLGDYEERVFAFFRKLGYDNNVSYEQFL